jgi:NAD(P)-dependent dehydrogenase (short-subunit alcohol dehydrogenase family)
MSPLIAFIIGAGKNIGEHTAATLKAKGFKVALGSRKPDVDQLKKDGYFPVSVDAGSPESLKAAFSQINRELGPPNCVIFNGKFFYYKPNRKR